MAHPIRKHSRSRRDKRRANWKFQVPAYTLCPETGKPILPHTASPYSGFYRGRKIVEIVEKSSEEQKS